MPEDAIVVGALLPFSGEQAAVGINIEQAVRLAVEDVNAAGGIDGHPFALLVRDSNSGSKKGLEEAKKLLNEDKVKYLIGPEENSLGKDLISEVKRLDILHILPGYAAPTVEQTGRKGAWIRLAPDPAAVGCAMANSAVKAGHKTAAALVMSDDDYQTVLATAFNSHFAELGGRLLGTITLKPDQSSYLKELSLVTDMRADFVAMMAYPTTAAIVTQDKAVAGMAGDWYLAPTLFTNMFLENIPFGSLNGFLVFSPSLSLKSECKTSLQTEPYSVDCVRDNSKAFIKYYGSAWGGDHPLPASRFYYDAVVLLALSLARAHYLGETDSSPVTIREHMRYIAEKPGVTVDWRHIGDGFEKLEAGGDISYSGAAAEYEFIINRVGASYGVANHRVIDAWSIRNNSFKIAESIGAYCSGSLLD